MKTGSSRPTRTRAGARRSPEDRAAAIEEKITAAQELLNEQVRALQSGDDWRAWLRTSAQFHTYSFNNQLLIHAQRPGATQVAGYRTWQGLGRQVNKGERGLVIFAPIVRRRDEDTPEASADSPPGTASTLGASTRQRGRIVGYRPTYVWDVAQTSGDALPNPPAAELLQGQAPEGLWDRIADLVAREGFTLDRGDCIGGANGVTDFAARTVRVRADIDDAQAVKTLAHELGHVLLHDLDQRADAGAGTHDHGAPVCRGRAEVEAESVAFIVTQAHNLDSSDYSFPYVATWATQVEGTEPADAVKATGERVVQASRKILNHTQPTVEDTERAEALSERIERSAAAGLSAHVDTPYGVEEMHRLAQAYADRGWYVFPLRAGGKIPALPAAHQGGQACPGLKDGHVGHGQLDASVDPQRVHALFTSAVESARGAAANMGIFCEPSGLLVVDIDEGPGKVGTAAWAKLTDEHGQVDTFTVRTQNGGRHLYFAAPAGVELRNTAGKLGASIDTRSNGYVVAPGSVGDAGVYRIERDVEVAPAPQWLVEALTARLPAPSPAPAATLNAPGRVAPHVMGQSEHDQVLARVRSLADELQGAPFGQGNNTAARVAFMTGQYVGAGQLERTEAMGVLLEAVAGWTWESRDSDFRVMVRTIESSLDEGSRRPRPWKTQIRFEASALPRASLADRSEAVHRTSASESVASTVHDTDGIETARMPAAHSIEISRSHTSGTGVESHAAARAIAQASAGFPRPAASTAQQASTRGSTGSTRAGPELADHSYGAGR